MNKRLKTKIIESTYRIQGEFARQIGMSPDQLSKIIHGWKRPTKEEQIRIAEALDSKVEDLF